MTLLLIIAVALAGALGAIFRYSIDYLIAQRMHGALPLGTMTVNLLGSFLLGLLVGLAVRFDMSATLQVTLAGGFLGSFTTFSTWMYESVRLAENRQWGPLAAHIGLSIGLGTLAAAIGLFASRSI